MNLIQVCHTAWQEDSLVMMTTIEPIHVEKTLKSYRVDKRTTNTEYTNGNLVEVLKEAYPDKVIHVVTEPTHIIL